MVALALLRANSVEWIEAVIVVDNNPNPYDQNFLTPWGLSIYVRTPNAEMLFDTGISPETLKHNAERLGIDLSRVRIAVISHEHGDHAGGLEALDADNTTIYGAPGVPTNRIVDRTLEISQGIYALNPLYGPPWETSLLVNVNGYGGVLFVGCSHPGIVRIVKSAGEIAKARAVIGGLHLAGASRNKISSVMEELRGLGVERIGAIHCSGDGARRTLEKMGMLLNVHVGSRIIVSREGASIES